jgi:hypothetical protein
LPPRTRKAVARPASPGECSKSATRAPFAAGPTWAADTAIVIRVMTAASDWTKRDPQARSHKQQAEHHQVAAAAAAHRFGGEHPVAGPIGDDADNCGDQKRYRGADAGVQDRQVPCGLQVIRQPGNIEIASIDETALRDEQAPHRRAADQPEIADAAVARRRDAGVAPGEDVVALGWGQPPGLFRSTPAQARPLPRQIQPRR